MTSLRLAIKRRIVRYRTRGKTHLLKEVLWGGIVFAPFIAGLALHFLLGVSLLALLTVGTIAAAIGCVYFVSKADEFLAGFWVGISLLLAVLVSYWFEGRSSSL